MAGGRCGRRNVSGAVAVAHRAEEMTCSAVQNREDVPMRRHGSRIADSCSVERQLCELRQRMEAQNAMLEELLRAVRGS